MASMSLLAFLGADLFGMTVDPRDEGGSRSAAPLPGLRHFRDFDRQVSRLRGITGEEDA